ncbi:hypothetical protein HY249_02840 [Candidatus Azambacteria bacterium]|nr:hypothetical protein [Candidatus Azambacteria bacterium]
MVQVIKNKDKILYQCEECGFKYAKKEIAEKCQAWCKEHKSCNLDIIKYAIKDSVENKEN